MDDPEGSISSVGLTDEFRNPPRVQTPMAPVTPRVLELAVYGPIARSDLPGLCDRVCALLGSSGADVALCDVRGVEPDAVTVEALARLQLGARRHGCEVRLRNASDELLELVGFMGLRDVLPG